MSTRRCSLVWCITLCVVLVTTVAATCPTGVTGAGCDQCDEWNEYYGVFPDCRRCVAGVGDYCSLNGTLTATAGTTCDCLCKNSFNGPRCDQCPAHRDTGTCAACDSGYEDAITNGQCGQKCTAANCTFKGNASGNAIDGCTCSSCVNQYSPATFCSQCLAGYDIAFDCAACLPGFEGYSSGYCARRCTPALDCNGTNIANASGNLLIGCTCHCKNAWFGGSCSQCAPLHNASSDCAVCVDGHTEFPNCTRICREDTDCNSHALSASGNLRIGCTCACRNFWSGPACDTCPTGYNITDDCGSCSSGYTLVSGACIRDCDSSDCHFHSNNFTGIAPNCTCICRNGWSGNRCQTCTLPFTGLDCDQCAPTFTGTGFPDCFRNCTALGNCSGNTTTSSPSRSVPMTATANMTTPSISPATRTDSASRSPTTTTTSSPTKTPTAGGSRSSVSHTRSSIQAVSLVRRHVTSTPTATATLIATVIVTAPQPPPPPLPLPLTPVAGASQTVVAAVGSVGVVSTVAVIVSSSGAIARIAQCLDDDDDTLSPLVHPLRFAAGAADDPLRFLRAAVIGNALLIPAWAAVTFGFLLPFGLLLAVEQRRRRAFSALRAQLRHRPDITRITDLDEHEGPPLSVRMLVKVVVRPGSALATTTAAAGGGGSAPHWAHGSLRELRAEMGWPSVLVLPLVAMAEGTAAAVTGLFVADDGAAAVIPALLGVAVLALAVAWWVRALKVVVPSADVLLEPASPIGLAIDRLRRRLWPRRWRRAADGGNTATAAPPTAEQQSWRWALLTPAFEFRVRSDNRTPLLQVTLLSIDSGDVTAATAAPVPAPPKKPPPVAGQGDFFRRRTEREARHDHIIGGKALRGAELGGFLCALGVGVAEGLPATSAAWCEARVTVAFVLFVLQGLLGMTTTMPFENVAIGALSMVSFVGATAALMNVYGGETTDQNTLQRTATIVGVLGLVAIIAGLVRPVTIARRMLHVADARIAQEVAAAATAIAAAAPAPTLQLALSLTSTDSDDFDMAPTAPPQAVIISARPAVPPVQTEAVTTPPIVPVLSGSDSDVETPYVADAPPPPPTLRRKRQTQPPPSPPSGWNNAAMEMILADLDQRDRARRGAADAEAPL